MRTTYLCIQEILTSVIYTVYVPASAVPALSHIADGSGIVGELQEDGSVLLDFEGNTVGSPSLNRYANRVLQAAARQERRYPTRARMLAVPDDLVAIGEFDAREQVVRLTGEDSAARLATWLGLEEVPADELIARRD